MIDSIHIEQVEQHLKHTFCHLSIHHSKADYLETMNHTATKQKAIKFLLNKLNLSAKLSIAFGDNFNDLDMLSYVGFSVAMGNAPEQVKKQCKLITTDNDSDGIALVLEKYML